MISIKTLIALAAFGLAAQLAQASDYEGAVSRKGETRGEACESAKQSAAIKAQTAGISVTGFSISTGPCECSRLKDTGYYQWECTVSWQAYEKPKRY